MIARTSSSPANGWVENHFEVLEPVVRFHAGQLAKTHPAFRNEESAAANELWLELVRKSPRYDPTKATPQTFARLICRRKIISIIRAENALRRGGDKTQAFAACNLETTLEAGINRRHRGIATDDFQVRRDLEIDVQHLSARLNSQSQSLAVKLQEMSPTQAAKELGLSPEELSLELETIRECFQRADLDKYHTC